MQRISEGALSPDGTVLATASHDGFVKFWQIYIEGQDQPRYWDIMKLNIVFCSKCRVSKIYFWKILRNAFFQQGCIKLIQSDI